MNERERLLELINDPCNSMNCCQPCINCKDDKRKIVALIDDGHTYHCACRQLFGDGECECRGRGIAPGPISAMVLEVTETVSK